MVDSFLGIETARRALQAHQQALDITAHNIANANAEGYSRQVAQLQASKPYPPPSFNHSTAVGQIGTGVEVKQVQRLTDAFIVEQIWIENQRTGRWETRRDALKHIELVFNEPSDSGILSVIDSFWQSLEDLGNNPEDRSVRSVVRQNAHALAEALRHTRQQLHDYRRELNQSVYVHVAEINSIAVQLAEINVQVARVLSVGDNPNDLYDKREVLLNRLSRIVDVEVVQRSQGMVAVAIGGIALVDGEDMAAIEAVTSGPGTPFELRWAETGGQVDVSGGELAGTLEIRDGDIVSYISDLDDLAEAIITEMNRVHRQGYDLNGDRGGALFIGTNAETIGVAPEIDLDLNKIAASATGEVGNGDNAIAMAQLKQELTMAGGKATFSDFFEATISRLGVASQTARRSTENQQILLGHLENLRESVSGVNLDEEMANIVQFQHAYAGAARVMTTMDELLDLIINRLGLTGR